MPSLILWRHAKSSWSSEGLADHDRPLNSRGRAAAQLMAHHIAEHNLFPEQILCSTAQRTRQTLEPLLDLMQDNADINLTRDIYDADAQSLLDLIRTQPMVHGPLMIIGHNPTLGDLTSALIAPDAIPSNPHGMSLFPTAALAVLSCTISDWTGLKPGEADLEMFVRPRDLQNVSGSDGNG